MATQTSNLTPIFLDTSYVYALVNKRDQWHEQAVQWQRKLAQDQRTLVTTQLILVEIADGLAAIKFRAHAVEIIEMLRSSHLVEVASFSSELLSDALKLYQQRADKDWGLTDCASFITMRERNLVEALTIDQHFTQAGFRALLRDN
ncbi:MAG: PIN domain-containing protein [Pyrinomonadaceae bacterium]